MAAGKKQYRVKCWGACETPGAGPCGINYPPGRRAVEGDVVDDLPAISLRWLLAEGLVEQVDGAEDGPKEEAE